MVNSKRAILEFTIIEYLSDETPYQQSCKITSVIANLQNANVILIAEAIRANSHWQFYS